MYVSVCVGERLCARGGGEAHRMAWRGGGRLGINQSSFNSQPATNTIKTFKGGWIFLGNRGEEAIPLLPQFAYRTWTTPAICLPCLDYSRNLPTVLGQVRRVDKSDMPLKESDFFAGDHGDPAFKNQKCSQNIGKEDSPPSPRDTSNNSTSSCFFSSLLVYGRAKKY